jgi:hypothetical protein
LPTLFQRAFETGNEDLVFGDVDQAIGDLRPFPSSSPNGTLD